MLAQAGQLEYQTHEMQMNKSIKRQKEIYYLTKSISMNKHFRTVNKYLINQKTCIMISHILQTLLKPNKRGNVHFGVGVCKSESSTPPAQHSLMTGSSQ